MEVVRVARTHALVVDSEVADVNGRVGAIDLFYCHTGILETLVDHFQQLPLLGICEGYLSNW